VLIAGKILEEFGGRMCRLDSKKEHLMSKYGCQNGDSISVQRFTTTVRQEADELEGRCDKSAVSSRDSRPKRFEIESNELDVETVTVNCSKSNWTHSNEGVSNAIEDDRKGMEGREVELEEDMEVI
jgi:hypothetical protein